jgi:hypothetical protein
MRARKPVDIEKALLKKVLQRKVAIIATTYLQLTERKLTFTHT